MKRIVKILITPVFLVWALYLALRARITGKMPGGWM